MSIDEALNVARVAIHKYFMDAQALPVNATYKDIEASRNTAIGAIMQFTNTKREHGEMSLSPYEERSLESFDAAEIMMQYKLGLTEQEVYGGGKCACC